MEQLPPGSREAPQERLGSNLRLGSPLILAEMEVAVLAVLVTVTTSRVEVRGAAMASKSNVAALRMGWEVLWHPLRTRPSAQQRDTRRVFLGRRITLYLSDGILNLPALARRQFDFIAWEGTGVLGRRTRGWRTGLTEAGGMWKCGRGACLYMRQSAH
jgi:hypothetical protein